MRTETAPNTGHGHVRKRPDGVRARCGGPAICPVCALEQAQLLKELHPVAVTVDIEALSARLHDIYQKEAHRRGDVRHHDDYAELSEDTKEWDRVLARWIVANWAPRFDPKEGMPSA